MRLGEELVVQLLFHEAVGRVLDALTALVALRFRVPGAITLVWLGSYYKSGRKTDSALIYLDSAIGVAGNAGEYWLRHTKGFALFQRAMIYEGQENFYTALNSYFEAFKNFDSTDPTKQKMVALRVATIYQELHNEDKALEYYKIALALYEKANDRTYSNEAEGIQTLIAGIYFNRGQLEKARSYLDRIRSAMPDTVEMVTVSPLATLNSGFRPASKKPQCTVSGAASSRWFAIPFPQKQGAYHF